MNIHNIRNYIYNEELEIKLYLDKVDVINYKELGTFDENKVTIYHNKGKIIIKGNNLVVSRLLNNEVLINGSINNIELG